MITMTGYATDTTWTALVADINAAIVTAGAALSGLMAYFVPTTTDQTHGYILLASGTVGASSSVAVTAGTSNDCSALLSVTSPTQTAGTADTPKTVAFPGVAMYRSAPAQQEYCSWRSTTPLRL